MKYYKNIAVIILAIILFTLSGCKQNPQSVSSGDKKFEQKDIKKDYLTLLYSASDTFNPYEAATDINKQLCKLLYEPLIKLDNEFNINNCVAENVVTDAKNCTVTLKNVLFSDGSALTADDVIYSYKLAKSSKTEYSYKLYEVVSVVAQDSKTIVFKLSKNDHYFANVLDFPIIKSESEKKKNSDGVFLPPIGNGRYKVNDEENALVVNEKFGGNPQIKEIKLINAPDKESLSHYVEIGAADMYYSDISDGNIVRMSGKKLNVNINHLVYIGINKNSTILEQNLIRQAISTGIDRKSISKDCYYNNALPATGFFNPVWSPVKSVQNIQTSSDKQITVENLEKIGYNKLDSNGLRKNNSGVYLNLSLLVNSENRVRVAVAKLIASQLSQFGFKITVTEKPYNEYSNLLAKGNFDLYLGEVAITPNMDISSLVVDGGSVAFGNKSKNNNSVNINEDKTSNGDSAEGNAKDDSASSMSLTEIIDGFYKGNNSIADIASVLQTEMPVVPVCYRTGVLFYNDNIENIDIYSESDIYFSIESYSIKNQNGE